ncbi:MAG: DUF3794 domain-containing protein [Firmicutes bacterium]|jgi:LysM repeat protein|nr:DUF3794 domain-containing protein [Bacillota bacterium]
MAVGIELKEELLKVEQVIGETTARKVLREVIKIKDALPTAEKIISVDVIVLTTSFQLIKNKILIEGTAKIRVLYVAREATGAQPVQVFEEDVSFELIAEVPGTEPLMNAWVQVDIHDVAFDLVDIRTIDVRVVISARVKVTVTEQLEVVTEVTGPKDLQVARELLKVEDVIGDAHAQALVTGRLTVPFEKPDIDSVISVEAKPRLTDIEVLDGQVIVEGLIDVDVLYAAVPHAPTPSGAKLPVHFFSTQLRFSQVVEVPGATAGMVAQARIIFEAVSFTELDFRTVTVDVVLKIVAKVTVVRQLEIVTDVTSKIQVLDVEKRLLRVEDVIGEDIAQTIIKEVLKVPKEKPNIERILRIDTSVKETSWRIIDGKVIIEGVIELQTLYVAQTPEGDQPVHHMSNRVKFTLFVEIPGTYEGFTAETRVVVEHVDFELVEDRHFTVKVLVGVFAKVTEPVQLNVVVNVVVVSVPPEGPCPQPTIVMVTIQPGDTLWALARKYNTTVEAIIQANPDINPENLQVGQVIQIPACPAPKG